MRQTNLARSVRNFGIVRRVGFQSFLQGSISFLRIGERREADRKLERSPRTQNVTALLDGRNTVAT
jgi:hypothetical protein